MLKKIVVAATSVSLAVSPAIAQSSAASAAPQPAMEQVEGSELRAPGSPFAPLLAITLVILGILLATETFPFKEKNGPRVSP